MATFEESARPSKCAKFEGDGSDDQASSSSSSSLPFPPPACPEEFLPAAQSGDDATVASALRNPLVDPNMADQYGNTALIMAAICVCKCDSVVKLLLADKRVDPNMANEDGQTALSEAARYSGISILKLLLADDRIIRTRPTYGGDYYDAALAWVNRQGTDAEAAPEEFIPAAKDGDDATIASALRNPLSKLNHKKRLRWHPPHRELYNELPL